MGGKQIQFSQILNKLLKSVVNTAAKYSEIMGFHEGRTCLPTVQLHCSDITFSKRL